MIERGVDTPGLDELIKVSRDNDVRAFIQGEHRIDEILARDGLLRNGIRPKQVYAPQ